MNDYTNTVPTLPPREDESTPTVRDTFAIVMAMYDALMRRLSD